MTKQFQTSSSDHRFFSLMSILIAVTIFLGFGNSLGQKVLSSVPTPAVIVIHAGIFSTWIFVFIAQAWFAARKNMAWHIRLGSFGILLAIAMLISAFVTAIESARDGHTGIPGVEFPNVDGFLLLNLSSAFIFTTLSLAGWLARRDPQSHKRLMLMATVLGLAPPGISRLPFISGHQFLIAALVIIFVLIGPIYDWRTRGRVHKIYWWTLPLISGILPPVVTSISLSKTWQEISSLLIGR